ncbi:MAG: SRPBCC family protein [Pseudomonadota bacterium]
MPSRKLAAAYVRARIAGASLLLALFFAEVSVAGCPSFDASQWKDQRVIDDVKVSTYGSPIPNVRSELTIAAAARDVLRATTDYDRLAGVLPRLEESEVESDDGRVMQVRQRLSMPAFISDRSFRIRVERHRESSHRYIVAFCLVDATEQISDGEFVVPAEFYGRWTITAQEAETSLVVHEVRMDPGGKIPKWLVGASIADDVPALMHAIARHIETFR